MLKILIKSRLLALLDSVNQLGGKNSKRKNLSFAKMIMLSVLLCGIIAVSVGIMFHGFCETFVAVGAPWAFWVFATIYATMLCIIGSIFTVKTQIFESKDNDLLLSMPIPQRYIFISRMIVLLIVNVILEAMIMLPCLVVYCITVGISFIGAVGYVSVLLLLPFLSLTLSTVVAWIVSEIASRVRHKNLITVVLFLAFLGGYMYFSFSIGGLVGSGGALDLSGLKNTLVFWWSADAIANGQLLPILWLGLSAIVPAIITLFVLDKTFVRITTTKKALNRIEYKGNKTKSRGVSLALLKKELGKFFSSVSYILNAGIGTVMTLVISIIFATFSKDVLPLAGVQGLEWLSDMIPMAVVIACAFFGSMSFVSAPSVSLEDKQLWILHSMPIDPKSVLMAKFNAHMIVSAPLTLISAIILCIAYEVDALISVFVVITVLATVVLCDYVGLFFGLMFPKFGWQNENAVIKQSMAVTVSMLSAMAFFVGMGVLGYFTSLVNPWFGVGTIFAVCVILSSILHLYLIGNGARKFENLKK